MQPWYIPVAILVALALVTALARSWVRRREHAANVRYVALLRSHGDLMAKLKAAEDRHLGITVALGDIRGGVAALIDEQGDMRRAVRNGQEAMVVLSEQLGMEFGELRKLLTPKPVRKPPVRAKP